MNTDEARGIAATLLADVLPQRWRHVQAVGVRATAISPLAGDLDDVLARAAWLHDIGYAPDLAVTGFHPLDGAYYLESIGRRTGSSASSPTIRARGSRLSFAAWVLS